MNSPSKRGSNLGAATIRYPDSKYEAKDIMQFVTMIGSTYSNLARIMVLHVILCHYEDQYYS